MSRLWNRCPFQILGLLFVGIVAASVILSTQVPSLRGLRVPFFGSIFATLVVGVVIEIRRRRPNSCPWLDFGGPARVLLYLSLFVVGLAVVLPGIWPSRSIEWPLRIPAVLLAIAFPALLAIHLKVDHSDLEESGVRRGLVFASRLPVYFICTVIALTLAASVLTLLGVME